MKKRFPLLLLFIAVFAGAIPADSANGQQDAHCVFAGKTGGKISKDEIAVATTFEFVGGDTSWKITELRVSVAAKDLYKEFQVRGDTLTDNIRNILMNLPAGSKMYIEYIRAGSKNMISRQLAPMSFTITD